MEKIRLGMVGGGKDANIGEVHRIAARLNGQFELVAGALSSTPEKSIASGKALGLAEGRCYGSYAEMAKAEAARPDGIRAVAIVTPNHMHLAPAKAFLEQGIHVICDKPLAAHLSEAEGFAEVVENANALFILTHTYTGYPLVRQMREMVAAGELGDIRVVQVEYAQDWLAAPAEDNKQAAWRGDPAQSGPGGATADIGTHALNLATYITGLKPAALAADLQAFVPGRLVDDNGHVLLKFEGGARGMLWCSQVATGKENDVVIRIYGDKAGIEWEHTNPNELRFTRLGEPKQILTRNGAGATPMARAASRVPGGHPEGYLEAFGNLYSDAAEVIRSYDAGKDKGIGALPGYASGLEGMRFIQACVDSSEQGTVWIDL